ncbi:hypothetical protein SLE2022_165340 [Rubroshorea leprosula]
MGNVVLAANGGDAVENWTCEVGGAENTPPTEDGDRDAVIHEWCGLAIDKMKGVLLSIDWKSLLSPAAHVIFILPED